MDGDYDDDLTIEGETHVGELSYEMKGNFDKDVDAILTSNTGELNLKLPQNSPVKLTAESNKFTSNVDIKIDDYTINDDVYIFNSSAKGGTISIEASVNIGDLTVEQ